MADIISQVAKKRIDLAKSIPLKTPLVIYVEPSGFCNLNCAFCFHSKTNKIPFPKSKMKFSLWKKMVDDCYEFEDKIKLLRICGNGEPLFNKHIIQMAEYAKKSNRFEKIELVTNAILLNDELIKYLPKYIDRIIISVEGLSGDDYLKFTSKKINFEKFVNNIKKLYKNRLNSKIHIKIHHLSVKTQERKKLFFDIFERYCDEIYIEGLVELWPEFDISLDLKKTRFNNKYVKKNVCTQIFKGFQVQAEGEVVACCVDWQRKNHLGDINNESLYEIWHGKNLKELQYQHLIGNKNKIDVCSKCKMNDVTDYDYLDDDAKEILKRYKEYNES